MPGVRLLLLMISSESLPPKTMWYFILRVSPKPNTELAKEAGGAYVNCWINFREKEGAEHLAKFYLEQAGWNHEETQEASWVEKEDYDDDPEGMQNFLEAETDSGSFVVQQWGLNGEEED
jgi:hypothetical protein